MPDQKRVGAGTILKLGDAATPTEVFTAIAKIRRIGELSEESPLVDATDLESTGREYIGGLADGSEFDVEAALLMDSATHTALDAAFTSKIAVNFELLPNQQSKKIKFAALVRSRLFGPFEPEGIITHRWRMKISGAVTLAAAS
jgi:hypothetical protein